MKTTYYLLALLVLGSLSGFGEVVTKEVTYKGGGVEMKGLIAWDDSIDGKRPGVLVVHEWWGHNDYARKRAKMLAELGYVGMAIDMYGGGKTADHPKEAGKFSSQAMSNLDQAEARFKAAMEVLNDQPVTDPDQTAAIGYCFGGGVVLHMARLGVDLDGVVSFHGSLDGKVEAKKGKVKADVLVLNGAEDKFISQESIEAFKKEMEQANVDYEFVNYEGALHSFTNPEATEKGKKFDLPIAYNKKADKKSWARMREFFDEIFADHLSN